MYLEHLSICGFRGLGSRLELPLDHRTIIYGPNGSGKSCVLQAVPWAIYGKLPFLTGTVFTREDALVNDFLDQATAEVTLTLSGGVTISRTRDKQRSTGRGKNPLTVSLETDDPERAVQQLVDLSLEEFFAAVFLHQETIRDFITSTTQERSATIDRMLGTYLLRTLIKVVDPAVPAKAMEQAEESIKLLDLHLSQAGVIGREVIQKRKEEHGDPAELPGLLEAIHQNLVSAAAELGLPDPEPTLSGLERALVAARQAQLDTVSTLEHEVGQLSTLKERYQQAAVTSWRTVRQRKEQYGDPADLPGLLDEIQGALVAVAERLELQIPEAKIVELEQTLTEARRAQPSIVGRLEKKAGQISTLKERYEQISDEAIDDVSIPHELENRQVETQARINALNREIPALNRELTQRQAMEQELAELSPQVQMLPGLCDEGERLQRDLDALEAAGKQGELYNQILSAGLDYLEQAQPEQCPLCKQQIANLQTLLTILHEEMPADVERMRQECQMLREALVEKQDRITQLEKSQTRVAELERTLAESAEDLPSKITDKQRENENLTSELGTIQAEIAKIEGRIKLAAERRTRLNAVVREIESELGRPPGEDLSHALDQAIRAGHERASEIESLDFEPIAAKLDQAKQLSQIEKDEAELHRRLDAVLEEVEEALGQPPGKDVGRSLDRAIRASRERAAEIQALDFQSISQQLNRASPLAEIQKDEGRLQQLESDYQTGRREKARLGYQIQRLTDLRNALADIAQTTKRHQQAIVAGILNELNIDRYYQQLDPHPAYRQLQIEPELTKKGIYNYWIKALTDDRSHGTYVQTRFSTAQANCAAIAIFLAVNQHLSEKVETIILDDPSQSLDPEHQMRLVQTLASIPRQVIVATEDPQMFELLANAFESPTIHQLEAWTVRGASLAS